MNKLRYPYGQSKPSRAGRQVFAIAAEHRALGTSERLAPSAPEVDLHVAVSTRSSVMRERHKDLKKCEDARVREADCKRFMTNDQALFDDRQSPSLAPFAIGSPNTISHT